MQELLRTNDPVLINWVTALLEDAGIPVLVFDQHTSILDGSIGAIPRRVVVDSDDYIEAYRLLAAMEETRAYLIDVPAVDPGEAGRVADTTSGDGDDPGDDADD